MSNKAFLISIKPQFAELIFSGDKTVELRRVPPKAGPGDLALVYVSSPTKQLQGCFEVARIDSGSPTALWRRFGEQSGVSRTVFMRYFRGKDIAHAIVIKRAWKLPTAVCLSTLRKEKSGFRPPQNFHYLNATPSPFTHTGGPHNRTACRFSMLSSTRDWIPQNTTQKELEMPTGHPKNVATARIKEPNALSRLLKNSCGGLNTAS